MIEQKIREDERKKVVSSISAWLRSLPGGRPASWIAEDFDRGAWREGTAEKESEAKR